jgi:hypothetical protein
MHPPAIAVTIRTTGYQKTIFPIVKNRKSTRLISILLLSPIDADGKIAINQLAFPETEYSSVGMNTTISDSTIAVEVSDTIDDMHNDAEATDTQQIHPANASAICNSNRFILGRE